jgi:Fe2+ transport system protein FeoA
MRNDLLPLLQLRVSGPIEGGHLAVEPGASLSVATNRSHRDREGNVTRPLVACRAGDRVVVGAVQGGPSRVDRLASLGIMPGVELRVQQTRPVVVVESDETVLALDREVAQDVLTVPRDARPREVVRDSPAPPPDWRD